MASKLFEPTLAPWRLRLRPIWLWCDLATLVGMALGLVLCYGATAPPLSLAGLCMLGGLALLRPDLALLLVPLTAPLFAVPAASRIAAAARLLPHELALLVAAAAAGMGMLVEKLPGCWPKFEDRGWKIDNFRSSLLAPRFSLLATLLRRRRPEILFLAAGIFGLLLALPVPAPRQDALRAFRWFIAEPLLFTVLLRLQLAGCGWRGTHSSRHAEPEVPSLIMWTLAVLLFGGALVGLLAMLQFAGYDLVAAVFQEAAPLPQHTGVLDDLRRATSVYTNPNNLGLYLGRVWPLGAALLLAAKDQGVPAAWRRAAPLVGLCALLCLGGILVSFSRGAWIGAGAAMMVLLLPVAWRWLHKRWWPVAAIVGGILAATGVLMVVFRGGLMGGSSLVRLLLWREALAQVQRHPFGLGLDQFYYYHHPAFGRSLIDPLLANTSERDARQPHNVLLELWFELGPLGLAVFGWLLVRAARQAALVLRLSPARPAAWLVRGALAALVAALIHGMVDTFYFWPDLAITFWLLLVIVEASAAVPPR